MKLYNLRLWWKRLFSVKFSKCCGGFCGGVCCPREKLMKRREGGEG